MIAVGFDFLGLQYCQYTWFLSFPRDIYEATIFHVCFPFTMSVFLRFIFRRQIIYAYKKQEKQYGPSLKCAFISVFSKNKKSTDGTINQWLTIF